MIILQLCKSAYEYVIKFVSTCKHGYSVLCSAFCTCAVHGTAAASRKKSLDAADESIASRQQAARAAAHVCTARDEMSGESNRYDRHVSIQTSAPIWTVFQYIYSTLGSHSGNFAAFLSYRLTFSTAYRIEVMQPNGPSAADDSRRLQQKVPRLEVQTAAVRFGCSECLCISIESHQPALLRLLLSRRDVAYRDMLWADFWVGMRESRHIRSNEYFPLLHNICPHDDLSLLCRRHSGNESFDVELREPFNNDEIAEVSSDFSCIQPKRILVSLPMIARWHSSEHFNAEQNLRDSGNFDYTEPQFFDCSKKGPD